MARAAGPAVAGLLSSAREAVEESLREQVARTPCDAENPLFRDYLRARLVHCPEEVLIAVFLDAECRFICDEPVGQGGMSSLTMSGRPLFRRAMELNATALILAHNHPSGNARPSDSDVKATRRLASVARAMEIHLLDHLVVGRRQISSMRLAGLL